MAVEWGIKQAAGIGANWISIPIEETLIIEPNVVYQFNFSVPKVKWWQIFTLWRDFDPRKFVISFQKDLAEKAGVRPEEIKILWQEYSPETRTYQVQIQYIPIAGLVIPVPIALGPITILILTLTGCFITSLAAARYWGVPVLKEIKKLVTVELSEEIRKALTWVAIPVSILGIGWIASTLARKKK